MAKRLTGRNAGNLSWNADASPQARQARRFAGKDPVEYSRVLGGGGACWCGAAYPHPWPGKDGGAPHPRDWPGRVNGQPYRLPDGGCPE